MLPKKYRLIKNNDFAEVAQKGKAVFGREISLKWTENNLSFPRFGIVVSLKVDKKATIRNKIKRRIRNILKNDLPFFIPGYDFLILTRKGAQDLDYSQIKSKLLGLFKKGHLMTK